MARSKDRQTRAHNRKLPAVDKPLRVVGGTLRGRPIAYSGDPRTRPMKQRVREAMFNLLGTRVKGTHVIDLFAGTGALAWEALSRGALRATLIERHFPTSRLIEQNAKSLGLADRVALVPGDTFVWGKRLMPHAAEVADDSPWLVFCSPPYDLYVDQHQQLLELLTKIASCAPPHSLFVVESDERFDTSELPTTHLWDVRQYPPAVLAVGEPQLPGGS